MKYFPFIGNRSIDRAIFLVLFMKLFLGETTLQQTSWYFSFYIVSNPSSVMFHELKMQELHIDLFSGAGHPCFDGISSVYSCGFLFTVVMVCIYCNEWLLGM